jgi:hypothetical protein
MILLVRSSAGIFIAAPLTYRDKDTCKISKFPPNQHLHELRRGLLVWGYDRSCRESDSPAPLTMPRHKKRKIGHETEIFIANEHAPHVCKLQIYRITPKNTAKSHKTIPLKGHRHEKSVSNKTIGGCFRHSI